MKTAVDLPDALVREVKVLAAERGQELNDVIADLLRSGLDAASCSPMESKSRFTVDEVTGLPTIACRPSTGPTPDRLSEILVKQEASWVHDASR